MRFYTFLFFLILINQSFSQSSRIAQFDVSGIGKNSSLIEWTMKAGSTCFSLSVQRGTDNENFNTVYNYPGVCGSNDEEVKYSWIDSKPISSVKNYYRLKLEEAEFTLAEFVDFSMAENDQRVTVFPNPAEAMVNIGIQNIDRRSFKLNIYDSKGNLILSETQKQVEGVLLDINNFKVGFYIIEIRFIGGGVYFTKLSKI